MTMTNITSGFKVTGVYPVNRDAVHVPGPGSSGPQLSLPEATGLAYIPLYSPAKRSRSLAGSTSIPVFSEKELCLFQRRFENGYDIDSDDRYNRWLRMYHPEGYELSFLEDSMVLHPTLRSSTPSGTPSDNQSLSDHSLDTHHLSSTPFCPSKSQSLVVMVAPSQVTGLQKLLTKPPPCSKLPQLKTSSSARVLTSSEHLRLMKEKEQQKQEAALQKEERKREREEKARLRAEQEKNRKRRESQTSG